MFFLLFVFPPIYSTSNSLYSIFYMSIDINIMETNSNDL